MLYHLQIPIYGCRLFALLERIAPALIALGLAATIFGQTDTGSPVSETAAETDLIHHGDLIDVDVIGSLEYDWRGTINPEGFLDGIETIPEPVYALCKSESDVGSELSKAFSAFLRDPNVAVRVVDRSRRAEAITGGAVRTPYRFQIRRPVRLSEMIILSGGITDRSSGEISIFRSASLSCAGKLATGTSVTEAFVKTSQSDGAHTTTIRIADLLAGKPDANPLILSGDIVTVTEALPVYIIGGVNNPKPLSLHSQITLSRAIASTGGLSKDAIEEKITIYRRQNGRTQILGADLSKIRNKQAEDIFLRPNDIVDVGQKGREKRRFPPNVDEASRPSAVSLGLRIID